MRIVIGVLCTSLWLLYAGQILSLVNWGWAVRFGLQDLGALLADLCRVRCTNS